MKRKNNRVSKDTEREARAYLLDEGTPPGTTVRISHGECGDTRHRLYITTHDTDGSAVMWCHNCSKWGRVPRHGGIPRPPKPAPITESKLTMEHLKFCPMSDAPSDERSYVDRYAIREYKTHIMWESLTHRVAYPIHYTGTHSLAGWQLRSFTGDLKYLTFKYNKSDTLQHILSSASNTRGCSMLIITEDLLSAAKCRYCPEYCPDALPLLGTYIHPTTAVRIIDREYNTIVVWLDNDVPEAIDAARKIKQLLTLMGHKNVIVIETEVEPKKHRDVRLILGKCE